VLPKFKNQASYPGALKYKKIGETPSAMVTEEKKEKWQYNVKRRIQKRNHEASPTRENLPPSKEPGHERNRGETQRPQPQKGGRQKQLKDVLD